MSVFLPLNGPNDEGRKAKAPSVNGWQSPSYTGVIPPITGGWIGLRCDGLVVIDCDDDDAIRLWREKSDQLGYARTWTRKTPRGQHFIYDWTEGSPTAPATGVWPGIDIRAGRSSQIVYRAPGYATLNGNPLDMAPFDPSWLPHAVATFNRSIETWSEMPEGVGNTTMTAIAGALRKQGMGLATMYRVLRYVNHITMTSAPMPDTDIRAIVASVGRYAPNPHIDHIDVVE